MGFFQHTPSFTNLSSVDVPDPLSGYSYLLHTLLVFVGTRGLTLLQNHLLLATYFSDCLSSSVGSLMRPHPINLLLLAQGVRRAPLMYPANRIRSVGRPRRRRCYKMCSIDIGLWCWDATSQAASDDAPSQRRGWRGVLSSSFEVGMRQGRVTLPCKSLQESVRLIPGKGRPPPQPMRPPEFQPRNAVWNHRLRVHIHHPHHPDRAGPTHPLT